MLFNKFKQEWPYYILLVAVVIITCYALSNMLSSPLTSDQLQEIKTKITAYNLTFVSVEPKQFFGCGSGHLYKVPVVVKNKDGTVFTVNYCSGNGVGTPSQIKI